MQNYDLQANVQEQFPKLWANLMGNNPIAKQEKPIATILGGQSGAGKSFGIEKIKSRLNDNVIVINGDEFRAYHTHFEKIGNDPDKDLAKETQEFANAMVNKVKNEAFKNRYNVIIEGTFRTIDTPINEINNLKKLGYEVGVVICTCPKELSWESTIERGDKQKAMGLPPRYVSKEIHDNIVANLANNVNSVFKNARPDFLEIYSREKQLFNSQKDNPDKIKQIINDELNGLNQKKELSNRFLQNMVKTTQKISEHKQSQEIESNIKLKP